MNKESQIYLKGSIISDVTYVNNSLVVSNGDSGTVKISQGSDDYTWKVNIDCPRHSSAETAEGFNEYCKSAAHEYAPSGGGVGTEPSGLNFYLKVNIQLTTGEEYQEVALAQGSNFSIENCWIGGASINNDSDGATFEGSVGLSGNSNTINFNTL